MQQWSLSVLEGIAPQRENASVVLDPASQSLYMFGGCDKFGAATDTLYSLNLSTFPKSSWQLVQCAGTAPQARWGHSSFVVDNKLWVFGGFAFQKSALTDLHCLDLSTSTWSTAAQHGCMPDRAFASSKQKTFQAVTAMQGVMLAFGREAQDENTDPGRPVAAAQLLLHGYDLSSATWRHIPTAGHITFDHLEALLVADRTLLAVGWSTAPAGVKADSYMQVCSLDLNTAASRDRLSGVASQPRCKESGTWSLLPASGSIPIARVGSAACVLPSPPTLVLHGGMLCSHSVQGRLTSDTFCFDLRSWAWTRLQPTSEKLMNSSSLNLPRVSHAALALPSDRAVLLIGGTSTRQSHASATTMECMRQVQGTSAASASVPAVAAPAATTAVNQQASKAEQRQERPRAHYTVQAGAAGLEENGWALSSTPTMIGLATQPFAHLSTPAAPSGATPAAMTPAVHAAPSPATASAGPSLARALVPAYNFSSFCCQDALSDVELVAGGVTFSAHRLLLCAQSPQLAQYLQQAEVSPAKPLDCKWVLHLQDLFPDVLKLMLMYMYGCLQNIPAETAPALFTASIRYGLPGLTAACLSVLVGSINFETVTRYILLAQQHKCGELTQACVVFAASTFERLQQVLNTPGFLHLNKSNPQVGALFVQMAMQFMAAKR